MRRLVRLPGRSFRFADRWAAGRASRRDGAECSRGWGAGPGTKFRANVLATVVLVGSALAWMRSARADCATDVHLSTCFDADNVWPHVGPGFFHFIGGPRTTLPGTLGVGLSTTYLSRPIVLALPSADLGGAEAVAVDHLVDTTLLVSLGVSERLEAGIALPIAVYRTGLGISPLTSQRASAISHGATRDVRPGAALRVLGSPLGASCPDPFGMAARLEVSLPTGDETSFAGDASPVAIPSLSGELRSGPFIGAFEVGARIRRTADLAGSRVGPQVLSAVGVGADAVPGGRLSFLLEALALTTLVAQHDLSFDLSRGERVVAATRPLLIPAEWQASLRSADLLVDGLSLAVGAGSSLPFTGEPALTAPRYRVSLSLRYAPYRAEPPK